MLNDLDLLVHNRSPCHVHYQKQISPFLEETPPQNLVLAPGASIRINAVFQERSSNSVVTNEQTANCQHMTFVKQFKTPKIGGAVFTANTVSYH